MDPPSLENTPLDSRDRVLHVQRLSAGSECTCKLPKACDATYPFGKRCMAIALCGSLPNPFKSAAQLRHVGGVVHGLAFTGLPGFPYHKPYAAQHKARSEKCRKPTQNKAR